MRAQRPGWGGYWLKPLFQEGTGQVFSNKLTQILGTWFVEVAISTNHVPKNWVILFENRDPAGGHVARPCLSPTINPRNVIRQIPCKDSSERFKSQSSDT